MKSPERILCMPIYTTEFTLIKIAKLNSDFYIPKASRIDIDDVFDGKSMCLLDYLAQVDDGELAIPRAVIYTVKEGVKSTLTGWVCTYRDACETALLSTSKNATNRKGALPITQIVPRRDLVGEHVSPDYHESDPGDGFDLEEWDESHDDGGETEVNGDASDKELVSKMNMKAEDKKDITGRVGAYIDMTRYYVFTSAKENHVSVLWKDREKAKNWTKYKQAVGKLKALAPKPRTMHASFTMKLSREGGWKECADRAREWQQWHSGIVVILTIVSWFFRLF